MAEEVNVLIYDIPLSIEKEKLEELRTMLSDDKTLNKAVREYSLELEKQDIETWEIDRNLIVTERGYKVALYE